MHRQPKYIYTINFCMQNPIQELSRLSSFLGKERDVSFLQSVTDECAIDQMRKRKGLFWADKGVEDSPNMMYREGQSVVYSLDEWFDGGLLG